jgi:bifunctional non-homologous end joining protein LigD
MTLSEYRRKRSFTKTNEPRGAKSTGSRGRAVFVVQLHHASRRHYDFRLEVDGVLKSWAVPKGPSYDPTVKRMAVEVEDHPLDYADFEGQIPKDQYGGGHVAQFDHGFWSTGQDPAKQLAKGHLRFELFGTKLRGGWHLVRSGKPAKQPQWLLFKDQDEFAGTLEADDLLLDVQQPPPEDAKRAGTGKTHKKKLTQPPLLQRSRENWAQKALVLQKARRAPAPTGPFEPQLAKLAQTPPLGAEWIHELKWDGYRLLVVIRDSRVTLWSRNALEWTDKLPEVRSAIESLGLASAALDGELIAGSGAKEDFNLLQATLSGERQGRLVLTLFDLLHVNGVNVADAPLTERKGLLRELLADPPPHLAFSSHIEGNGEQAYRLAGERHFEGIISKRADRSYQGGRSDEWRKIKQLASDEFAVVGYTKPKGSRKGFGSLLLAKPHSVHGWKYAGRVGTGFNDSLIQEVRSKLQDGQDQPTAFIGATDTDLRGATWFAPRLVVEVHYRGIGRQDLLRQASFKSLRPDKSVEDLFDSDRTENPMPKTSSAKSKAKTRKSVNRSPVPLPPALSSPDKIVFPDIQLTKQEVWNYYTLVADYLIPQIIGRALSIVRCPSGIENECFFQKHRTAGMEHVSSVRLTEESGAEADYLIVEDRVGLMELVQFNTLEFHPWGSLADNPDVADRVVFDLDPGPAVAFSEVKQAAKDIRRLLGDLDLTSFLRVSGGKGLHVVVPLNPGCDWELTKRFAHGFADALAQAKPHRFLATATKSKRKNRIFVDYLRNGRGATAVASYSVRARPGAPIALPVTWASLRTLESASAFKLREIPSLLARRRKDPWAGFEEVKQDLSRWASE